jgi:hypothetical protein
VWTSRPSPSRIGAGTNVACPTTRAVLRGSYAHGWLCFDNGSDKKRLSPIPGDWTACDEHTLEAYLRAADAVKASRMAIDFGRDGPLAEAG